MFVKRNNPVQFELFGIDDDGDDLTYRITEEPTNGTVTPVAGVPNNYIYTPNRNFVGEDILYFVVSDGKDDSEPTATVFFVQATNAPPVVVRDTYATDEDTPLVVGAPGVLANDYDVDDETLSVTLLGSPGYGTVELNADGSFIYTPEADFNGTDSFFYRVSDGVSASSSFPVEITVKAVNDAPFAEDESYATDEDTPLNVAAPGVLSNDYDYEGDALVAAVVAGPAHGTLNLSANGGFNYTPAANYNGSDSFRYRAGDGKLQSEPATVSITVRAVNDAPVAADVDGGNLTISETRNGTLRATDGDNTSTELTFTLVDAPAHGEATVNANGSFSYSATPGTFYVGADSFTFRATDAGGANSNVARVTFNIVAPPVSVVARDDEFAGDDNYAKVKGNVLLNDGGDGPLSAVLVSGSQHNNQLTLQSDGNFDFSSSGFVGTDSFTYRAKDASGNLSAPATVTIRVSHLNRAPFAATDYYGVGASGILSVGARGVTSNDGDADIAQYGERFGDRLTVALLPTEPARFGTVTMRPDGSFVYTVNSPAPTQSGFDQFYYTLSDGQGGESIGRVSISIQPDNNAPVAQNQSLILGANQSYLPITFSGSDPDGEPISYELLSLPTQGTLRSATGGPIQVGRIYETNGIFYQRNAPGADDQLRDSFLFRARDSRGLLSNSATVTIRIGAINTAPVAVADEATTTGSAVTIPVAKNDSDAEGDALSVVSVDRSNLRPGASLTITPDGQSVIYNPGSNFDPGSGETFSYRITDGLSQPVVGNVTVRQVLAGGVDASIRAIDSQGGYLGQGIVNLDGSGQTASGTTTSAANYPGAGAYQLILRNTGPFSDALILRGPAREPGASAQTARWSVRYFLSYAGSSTSYEITDQVTSAAGWNSDALGANTSRNVRIEVRPNASVPAGATFSALFDVRSARDDNARDVVGALTTKSAATPNG